MLKYDNTDIYTDEVTFVISCFYRTLRVDIPSYAELLTVIQANQVIQVMCRTAAYA
jgi:hypothetical protein